MTETKNRSILVLLVATILANGYLFYRVNQIGSSLVALRTDADKNRNSLEKATANLRAAIVQEASAQNEKLDAVLRDADARVQSVAAQVKLETSKNADELRRRLEKSQRDQRQTVEDLSAIKQFTTDQTTHLENVEAGMNTVKQQADSTRLELEQTNAELKQMKHDLNGYIATNRKELEALKKLGQKNYIDVILVKSNRPQRFGDVSLLLKSTDPKRNKFTVYIFADDEKIEKQNKDINEPIQFYASRDNTQAHELVVYQVTRDVIVGYLAGPKERTRRE